MPVKRTEQVTVTVEEKKDLTLDEREAKAKAMGIVVPLGFRSTTARKAYLNMRRRSDPGGAPSAQAEIANHHQIVERKVPSKTVVKGGASGGYNLLPPMPTRPISTSSLPRSTAATANILVLVPAGRTEDTVSFLFGPTSVRYAKLNSSSFDALNSSISYTRLLGRRQTMEGYNTGGTATTDILSLGLDGTSVYELGFGAEQISIATPSIGWSRSNIGLGNQLCGDKGSEAYCYFADVALSLGESLAD